MNKKKLFFDFLYIFLIVALIIFMVFVVRYMSGNSRQCLNDPIEFFETINEGAVCSCIKDGVTWPNTIERTRGESPQYTDLSDINLTGILIKP